MVSNLWCFPPLSSLTQKQEDRKEFRRIFIWTGLNLKFSAIPLIVFKFSKQVKFNWDGFKIWESSCHFWWSHSCHGSDMRWGVGLIWEVWTFPLFLSHSTARNPFQGWKLFESRHTKHAPGGRHYSFRKVLHFSQI